MPAKAGIQALFPDSRLRRNDILWQWLLYSGEWYLGGVQEQPSPEMELFVLSALLRNNGKASGFECR